MDINKLLKAGMNACGRVMEILPKEDIGTPKQFMMEVLQDETLPSINDLYPALYRRVFKREELISLGTDRTTGYSGFRIPLELVGDRDILGIKNFYTGVSGYNTGEYTRENNGYMGSATWLSQYPNRFGRFSSANLYESAVSSMMTYADLQLMGTIQEAPIPRFEEPNIFWINQSYGSASSFFMTLMLENDVNLISVGKNAYEGVKKLFILDIKKTIYNRFGMLANIDTAIGSIDLKIDDWSGAASERDELYDQYDSLSHLRKTSIIAG